MSAHPSSAAQKRTSLEVAEGPEADVEPSSASAVRMVGMGLDPLQIALEAEESAECSDDQRGYDHVCKATIDVRADRNRELRDHYTNDTADRHHPAENCDDHAPICAPRIVQIDNRESRKQRQQPGQIEHNAGVQRLSDHPFVFCKVNQHAN